jgi:HAD superfamily hydrolase (TIGR01450 family)
LTRMDLSQKRLFLFDLDGVFYRGKESRVKLGGTKVVNKIREQGKQLLVLTNNSTDMVETLRSNLADFNIPVRKEEILTSGLLTTRYLTDRYGKAVYYLVGEGGFDRELRKAGHRRTRGLEADVVVIGLDRFLSYDKLDEATKAANAGADLVATHKAKVYMSKSGAALGPGAIVKALEFSTGKRAVSIGKPSPLMFRMALKMAGCSPDDAVMCGDQIDTDLVGAARAGVDSVLVLTGIDKSTAGTGALGKVKDIDELVEYF